MTPLRVLARMAAGIAVAFLAGIGIAALSHVPYAASASHEAAVRLSWRVPGFRLEACRPVDPEELARAPAHMRRTEVCQRETGAYRLRVHLNEDLVIEREVGPSGFRRDRPAFVHAELRVEPGVHRLRVIFEPLVTHDAAFDPANLPAREELDTRLHLGAGEAVLVTLDPQSRGLHAVDAATHQRR